MAFSGVETLSSAAAELFPTTDFFAAGGTIVPPFSATTGSSARVAVDAIEQTQMSVDLLRRASFRGLLSLERRPAGALLLFAV